MAKMEIQTIENIDISGWDPNRIAETDYSSARAKALAEALADAGVTETQIALCYVLVEHCDSHMWAMVPHGCDLALSAVEKKIENS